MMINDMITTHEFRVDPFKMKDWYDIKAPALFGQRTVGQTPVNKTRGQSE